MSTSNSLPPLRDHLWGYGAIALGGLALMIAMLHIFGPALGPRPEIGQTIGEIAGDIRAAALRTVAGGEAPQAAPASWTLDDALMAAGPILGVLALLAAIASRLSGDPRTLATYGATLGGAAIVFQFVWWVAILIAGVMLLIAIVQNIDSILGG